MKIRTLLAGLFFITLGLPAISRAQPNSVIEQLERTQREMQLQKPTTLNLSTNLEAPEIYPGENEDVGPQRILRLKPRRTYFEVVADSQYFFTDNAYLDDQIKKDNTLFVNTIQAAFAPQPYPLGPGSFAPVVGFRSQWFNYGLGACDPSLNRLDFNAQTAFIGGRYQLRQWVYNAGFDFTRILDQDKYDEAYREYVPSAGVQRFFSVNDNLLFIAGAQVGYRFTEVRPLNIAGSTINDRFDGSLSLTMLWQIMPRLILQPFYRFQYTYYSHYSDNTRKETDRSDYVNSIGTSLTYHLTKNIAARVFANYEIKDSDYSKAVEYHKFDAGGGLALDVRF